MRLKKSLKTKRAQAVVEYIVLFVILTLAIVAVCGGFNPEKLKINSVFDQAVNSAIDKMNK